MSNIAVNHSKRKKYCLEAPFKTSQVKAKASIKVVQSKTFQIPLL